MRRAVPPVLVPGRHPEPRRARDAGLDPRGRRARLRARARLRRRVRQPGPARRAASSATARPRPGRWRRAGTRTSSSTRRATAPCCRSCTSTATRSPTRRCSRASREDELRGAAARATATRRTSSRATTPSDVHQAAGRQRSTRVDRRDPRDPARERRERRASPTRPRWPMIVLRTPKGWTGPEDGRRRAGRGHLALPPGAAGRGARPTRAHSASSRTGCAATGPRSCSTTTAGPCPELAALAPDGDRADGRQPARQRRPAAARPRPARLPRLRRRRRRRPGRRRARRPRVLGAFLRDVMRRNPEHATSASSARTRPPRTGSAPCSR